MSTKIAIMSDFEYGKQYYFIGDTGSIPDTKCVVASQFVSEMPYQSWVIKIKLGQSIAQAVRSRYADASTSGSVSSNFVIKLGDPSLNLSSSLVSMDISDVDANYAIGTFSASGLTESDTFKSVTINSNTATFTSMTGSTLYSYPITFTNPALSNSSFSYNFTDDLFEINGTAAVSVTCGNRTAQN